LNVSPQSAHRHAVSFVMCFASVPTRVDPQNGQVGLVGTSCDMKTSGFQYGSNQELVQLGGRCTNEDASIRFTRPKRIVTPFSLLWRRFDGRPVA
jgi:hypothetical protein